MARSSPSRIILASGSATRRAMLEAAGLSFDVLPANVDEAVIREDLIRENRDIPREAVAERLAIAKALEVSGRKPGAFVIGSDQILALDQMILEKPSSLDDARKSLLALRGKTHALHSAVALARDGEILWRHTSTARLTMRIFDDAELERYLEREGASVTTSVGAYRIEGPAITLFEHVDGDHWTILGMPLLPLLAALRARSLIS